MKPGRFKYWDPPSLGDATDFLAERGDESKLLAGGQSLMPVLNMRLSSTDYLLDLNRVNELGYTRRENDSVRIGSLTRHYRALTADVIEEGCPLLHKAIPYIGHSAIRYRGTVGGSIAHADPSAELPAVTVALDAEFTLTRRGGARTLSAEDFFVSYFTTVLAADEILTEIRVPVQPPDEGSALVELARRHGDFALVGVAAAVSRSGEHIQSARICAFGVDDVPRRLTEIEQLVGGQELNQELIAEAHNMATTLVEPESDMHASADYRREMTGVLTARALREAFEDCQ